MEERDEEQKKLEEKEEKGLSDNVVTNNPDNPGSADENNNPDNSADENNNPEDENKKDIKDILLTRRNLIKIGIGVGLAAGFGYYSYTLLSKPKPKKRKITNVSNITGKPTGTETPTETETQTPSIPAYYQISLENGNAVAFNVPNNKIDFQGPNHYTVIQNALNSLPSRNNKARVSLKGDFISQDTIKIPSFTLFDLDGSITLGNNVNKALIQEVNSIMGTTQIEMLGGTYDGNKNNQSVSNYLISFEKVTNSHFANFKAQNAGKDCFVLNTECNNNIIENIVGKNAGIGNVSDGNGLDDRGDHNTWRNCLAENNYSDNWVIKCRDSTFVSCIGRNSIGSVGFGFFADRDITGNTFVECEAYGNKTGGVSLNIPEKSNGKSIKIENNSIQGVFYNNQTYGLSLRDVTTDGSCQNNTLDILLYNNGVSGLEIEQQKISNNHGVVVAYDNGGHDAVIRGVSNSFNIYYPEDMVPKIDASPANKVDMAAFSCSDSLEYWSMQKYCSL